MSQTFDPFAGQALEMTISSTPPQQEIWMAIQLGGDEASLAFNESMSLQLTGAVDEARLAAAWKLVAERHQALRTTFSSDGLSLCIEQKPRLDWHSENWTSLPPAEAESKRQAWLKKEVSTAFDLVAGPLFRTAWLQLAPQKSEFVLTAHHLVCDGYSAGILLSELCQVYTALEAGKTPALDPAPRYSDYAAEATKARSSAQAAEAERYWLKALGQSPETLDLPTEFPRPAQRTFQAKRLDYLIPASLLEQVKKTAAKAGLSLSGAFMTTFAAFLSRLSGQTEFVLGLPAAGQASPGFGGLVGHCVNTLPLPIRFDPALSLTEQGKKLKSVVLDGLDHQVLSFGSLLQKLQLPRDPSRIPLIPVLFNLDPPVRLGAFGSAQAVGVSNPRHSEAFELFFNGNEGPDGLVLEATYNTALFSESRLRAWLEDFHLLLEAAAGAPDKPLGQLPAVAVGSRSLQLTAWNNTGRPLPAAATALQLFEAQAAKTPEALAVRDSATSLTYRELNERANFLGQCLQALGAGAETLVGVCAERSVHLVAALLGVWKAGAAYVPLDPDFPADRLAHILEDSGLQLLVTETGLREVLAQAPVQRLLLDQETGRNPAAPERKAGGKSLAYILHTSGSTGRPKGVQIEQRSLVNFLTSLAADLHFSAKEILVAVTTLSFDIAGLELFLPLTTGANIVLASRDDALDGQRLIRLLTACTATTLQATPATWQLLIEAGWTPPAGFRALCGGEALPRDLARQLLARRCDLWNLYGPTETTIWSTLDRITDAEAPISIGRPIANTKVYLVDAQNQLLPVGAAGELLIGGLGVSRGYHNRPDLTSERFFQDPFSSDPEARVYRTGDICRFGSDGRLYYQARNDHQVKVRGFRIELGEIETALQAQAGVAQAVATVKTLSAGDVRLVGYVVPAAGSVPDPATLKTAVGNHLPSYMVPQHVVVLPKLPLTPNGKIDRKALPLPDGAPADDREYLPPVTPLQTQIQAVWMELLRLSRIGRRDSFFDIGGHSMLAARMLARLRDQLGLEIPMRVIFQAQTIESLGTWIEAAQLQSGAPAAAQTGPREELEF